MARQTREDDGVDGGGHVGVLRARRRDRLVEHVGDGGAGVLRAEETLSRESLPQDGRGSEDVDATIEPGQGELLGRHVGELAFDLSLLGRMQAAGGLRDAEVDHPRYAVDPDEHVLRRDVTVHDVERGAPLVARLVRRVQAGEHAREDAADDADGGRPPLRARSPKELVERLSQHEIHDQEELGLRLDHVERPDHVGVLDPHRQPRLVEEHRREVPLGEEVRVHPLDGDGARHAGAGGHATQVNGGHPAGRDRVVQRVPAKVQKRRRRLARLDHLLW